ncbi:MAG TPA: PLP-dependent aminotransferase family protein [Pseudolysinimonas sp.]|nr:PLP-dependent aminotransferase family protein [Pseudolysinimonas sp.]
MASLSARALASALGAWRGLGAAPAYAALADRIRLLVLDGRLALGTRLPAERELAAQLHLSRTTISAAYAELRDSGYLESLRGSGSMVRLPSRGPAPHDPIAPPEFLDFSRATLPAVPHVTAAAERAAALLPSYLGESGFDPLGLRAVRQALADRYTARGLPTDADQLMITVGAQHAIGLVARTLLSRGDRALVESPTYPHASESLRAHGARLVPVAVTTDEGWDEAGLEQAIQRTSPTLGYLMPDFQNPTGRSMPAEQRERVAALAALQGTTLIADETMGELGFRDLRADAPLSRPFAASASASAAARIVTIGSVGKSVWGGLRLGWIRTDHELIQRIARVRYSSDLGTPILDQLVVLELLGEYDRILAERRAYLRAGRDHLLSRLRDRLPTWELPEPDGGLTLWINIGAPLSSQLALAARNEGLVIAAGPRFGMNGVFERFLRVPFSHPPELIDRAVDALAAAWSGVTRHPIALGQEDLAEVV